MTIHELIKDLAKCEDFNAQVHFSVNIDKDIIKELADEGQGLDNEWLIFEEIYDDGTDVDIKLNY